MANLADLNVSIGADLAPLEAGLQQAAGDLQKFGGEVASSVSAATNGLAELYQQLDNLKDAQQGIPTGTKYYREYNTAIAEVTRQINVLEGREETLISVQRQLAESALKAAEAEKLMTTTTTQVSTEFISANTAGNTLTTGLNALSKGFSFVRQAAYLIPGIGVAGIFNLIFEGIEKVVSELDLFGNKVQQVDPILEKLKKESQDFQNSLEGVQSSALATGIRLQSFVDIARNGQLPLEQRNEALKEANKILGEHGEKLTLVNIYTKAATTEVQNFTNALVAQAVAAKYADQIADQIIKNKDLFKQYTVAVEAYNKALNNKDFDLQKFIDARNAMNAIAEEYNNRLGSIGGLYKDLNEETQAAVSLFTAVGTKSKDLQKLDDIIKDIYRDLTNIPDLGQVFGKSNFQIETDLIKRLEQGLQQLANKGITQGAVVDDLQVRLANLQFDILPEEMRKSLNDFYKKIAAAAKDTPPNDPIELKGFNVVTLTETQARAQLINMRDELQRSGRQVFSNTGILSSVPLLTDDEIKRNYERIYSLGKKATEEIAKDISDLFASLAQGIGEALGSALSGQQDPFSALRNALGNGIKSLGADLIKLGVQALIVQKLMKSLIINPSSAPLLIIAGIALEAIGTAISSKGVTAHAEGGVFTGPTMWGNHLIGEQGNEFLVGQSKLEALLAKHNGNGFQDGQIVSRIDGNDLVLVFNRQSRYNTRNYGNFKNG